MNFNEMFWFTLSEASSIVGFPRPKQMSTVLSSRLQKAKESRVAALLSPLTSPFPGQEKLPANTKLVEL